MGVPYITLYHFFGFTINKEDIKQLFNLLNTNEDGKGKKYSYHKNYYGSREISKNIYVFNACGKYYITLGKPHATNCDNIYGDINGTIEPTINLEELKGKFSEEKRNLIKSMFVIETLI
jgi:hypothetical protein